MSPRHHIRAAALTAAAAALLSAFTLGASAAPASASTPAACTEQSVPVAVPGLPGQQVISGMLCLPSGPPPSVVQVLEPGATYDNSYFNFPLQRYSYSLYAQEAGQATFAIDRFNTGASSMLASPAVTVEADADALHQVIGALTSGQVGGVTFSRVVTVGHSLGSIVAAIEAATYGDESGVILTGYTHALKPAAAAALGSGQMLVPAQQASPRFAGQPAGDMTTLPGPRATWFYAPRDSDPSVIATDQDTESVVTIGELNTFADGLAPSVTGAISVPVLQAVGSRDALFWCGTSACSTSALLSSSEAPFFAAASSYTAFVLRGSGHDLGLARNDHRFFRAATRWVAHLRLDSRQARR
jgi:pimeloyl-ACP methyl ester carboxylesterase